MRERTRENAHRLAGTLERYAADPRTVEQLREDMACLPDYIRELEGREE